MVGLIPHVSITSNAEELAEFDYIVYFTNNNTNTSYCYVSYVQPYVWSGTSNASYTDASGFGVIETDIFMIAYNENINDWVSVKTWTNTNERKRLYRVGTSTMISNNINGPSPYSYITKADLSACDVVTNAPLNSTEKKVFKSFSSDTSKLPQGLTEEKVNELIDESLNTTTSAGQQANTIINNTTNQYNLYLSGATSKEVMLENVQSNIDTLSDLEAGTILDAMTINNGLTYNQTIQDKLLNSASSNIASQITGKINQANQTFQNYSQGSVTQSEAVTQINQYITQLTNLITPETTTADIEAINASINTINGIKGSITNYNELSPDVAEEQVNSDQEEIEMLNELVSVMQDQEIENKLEDQEIAGNAASINSILEPVWQNKYFVYLIGTSSVLIVACILLHVRYRML